MKNTSIKILTKNKKIINNILKILFTFIFIFAGITTAYSCSKYDGRVNNKTFKLKKVNPDPTISPIKKFLSTPASYKKTNTLLAYKKPKTMKKPIKVIKKTSKTIKKTSRSRTITYVKPKPKAILKKTVVRKSVKATNKSSLKLVMKARATAYDLSIEDCGKPKWHPEYGITRSGTRAKYKRTIAVDPRYIKLGTKLYLDFQKPYNYLDGWFIAEDTGGAIKGKRIDVFLGDSAKKAVYRFGVRTVFVYRR